MSDSKVEEFQKETMEFIVRVCDHLSKRHIGKKSEDIRRTGNDIIKKWHGKKITLPADSPPIVAGPVGVVLKADLARSAFKASGFEYGDLHLEDMWVLRRRLKEAFIRHSDLAMNLADLKHSDFNVNENGSIKHYYLKVNGSYFKGREAISFNPGGFIGFCGWADTNYQTPIIKAFNTWLVQMEMKQIRR